MLLFYWLNKVKFNKGKNAARLIEVPKTPPKKQLDFNGYKLCNFIRNNVPKRKFGNTQKGDKHC